MTFMTQELEPCLARLGTTPEDKPSFVKEVYAIQDMDTLRQLVIRKERERQTIANDLEVAARIGLVISETNEAIQIKLEQLERENKLYQDELARPDDIEDDRIYLAQELDQARRELNKFRKEMDGLSAQLNDMASEMVDSRQKVSIYAKRLAEVEQKLASTREVNTNLQCLLDKALTSQKQSSSNTTHLVKNIQMDLARVMAENEQLRARIAELEHQQVECEEKLAAMVIQAQEYATRLEQAQDTIHSLSEPKLQEEEDLISMHHNGSTYSVSSHEGSKETEITKGPVFSAEFRQEMQKEIERNLNLRNEIRHRIITADTAYTDKKKSQEGLKYLVSSEKESGGLASLSTSTSTSTTSSVLSTVKKEPTPIQTEEEPGRGPVLRPASFLTGFGGFNDPGLGIAGGMASSNFITRGIPPRTFTSRNNEPSISTRFFQRLASRLDEYDKKMSSSSSSSS
ncbi:hypothetical protein CU098_013376 [Rhizopus stolonifer]|uniref:Uncharacterized protein n=1 Tax=Rhizopus stolonifer TaxID=4846 RepID=A0A367KUH2_RHIST|nr:hypothetical protein CU098_013376 [Rhizopus stolonifer]